MILKYSKEMVCVSTAKRWVVKDSKKMICEEQQEDNLCSTARR